MAKQKTLFEQLKSAEHQESVIEKSLFSNHGVRIAFMIIIIILTGLMFPNQRAINENGEDVRQVNIGVLWMNETIKAEFPFAIIRPESEIELEKERVLKSTPIICLNIENAISEAEAKLSALLQMCEGKLLESGILNETVTKNVLEFPQQKRSMIGQIVQKYREELMSTYYERRPLISVAISSLSDTVFIRKSKGIDMPMLKSAFSDTTLMRGQLSELFADKLQMQEVEKVVSTLIEILKPKYEVSKSLTQETKSNRLASIPRTLGIVRAGEVLIRKGERFDRLSALKVQSYVSNRGNSDTSTYSWSILLGSIGHSFLIFSMMILYLFFIRPVIFAHHQQLYGLLGIVLIAPIFSWITVFMNSSYPLEYAVIVPALSMLIAILFDSRTAFYSTVVMSLLIAGVRGSDYSVGLAMMIGGMVAAYSVRDIQARTQLFASIIYVFIGMSVSIASPTE